MKVKTADLIGPALDWAVARAEAYKTIRVYPALENKLGARGGAQVMVSSTASGQYDFSPGDRWSQGGPIIEREGIYLRANDTATEWAAGALRKNRLDKKSGPLFYAKTPLIAAMRCFVASKLGDEIDVPDDLV